MLNACLQAYMNAMYLVLPWNLDMLGKCLQVCLDASLKVYLHVSMCVSMCVFMYVLIHVYPNERICVAICMLHADLDLRMSILLLSFPFYFILYS